MKSEKEIETHTYITHGRLLNSLLLHFDRSSFVCCVCVCVAWQTNANGTIVFSFVFVFLLFWDFIAFGWFCHNRIYCLMRYHYNLILSIIWNIFHITHTAIRCSQLRFGFNGFFFVLFVVCLCYGQSYKKSPGQEKRKMPRICACSEYIVDVWAFHLNCRHIRNGYSDDFVCRVALNFATVGPIL